MARDAGSALPPAPRTKSGSTVDSGIAPRRKFPKHLVDIYDIKSHLGSGAFSTVWRCVHRATGQERAVKKIDTTELSPREIAHEIALMRLLRNPNVVRCYDVFLEAQYVNIVIDIFTGGDLIDGLNAHRRARGLVPDAQLAHLARQMVAAVAHVHGLKIVHRDIKGENFLCDRPDIGDPDCNIALADFGTAMRVEPGEQLSSQVGTPPFWAPEMWRGRYGFLVDVWAVGVTAFVLLAGKLPFDGEEQTCAALEPGQRAFAVPVFATPACVEFLERCMEKDQRKRPKATEAARLPWMSTPPYRREEGADKAALASADDGALGQALDLLGSAVVACCGGLGAVVDALASPKKAESVGAASAASAGSTLAPDKDEIEKQVTELSTCISKNASNAKA